MPMHAFGLRMTGGWFFRFRAHAFLLLCQVWVGAEQVTVRQLPDLWIRRVGSLYVLLPSLIPFGVSPRSYGRLHT